VDEHVDQTVRERSRSGRLSHASGTVTGSAATMLAWPVVHLARGVREQARLRSLILGFLGTVTVVGGAWGWLQLAAERADAQMDALSITFATLALFSGEAPTGTVNLPLGIARLAGILTTGGVILEAALRAGHESLQAAAGRAMHAHFAAHGDAERLHRYLAPLTAGRKRVLAAVDIGTPESPWRGAVAVPARGTSWVERVRARNARRVVIATGSDLETLTALHELVEGSAQDRGFAAHVLVEIDDRGLALTLLLWLARTRPDLDIDVVHPETNQVVSVITHLDQMLRAAGPPAAVALLGDTRRASAIADRVASELVRHASDHDGPEVPTLLVDTATGSVDAIRQREGVSLRVLDTRVDLSRPHGVIPLLDELRRNRIDVAIIDYEDVDLGVGIAGRLRYDGAVTQVISVASAAIPGVEAAGTAGVSLSEPEPQGILDHIWRLHTAPGSHGDGAAQRRSVRQVLAVLLAPAPDSEIARARVTIAYGHRLGAVEALPTTVLQHLIDCKLNDLQTALESLGVYFYPRND